ncbi:MAG TPA: efflux RND transporter periplasmic adaptor subunit [Bryobacteraceae bacterium]|nr:efflux RND transporter periplasmic adaptor subunit [Bryobacteraceae bacterium]
MSPPVVTAARVVERDIPGYLEATGSFEALEASDVGSEIEGRVIQTPVDVGAFVRQGQVILRLDDRDATLRLRQAEATQRQALAALRQAQERVGVTADATFNANTVPEVAAAHAAYESALAQARLAEADAQRYANLVRSGDVARSAFEAQQTRWDSARAQSNAARQQYEAALNGARQSNRAVEGAEASLAGVSAQLGLAQKVLADTVVKAPFDGYVSERPVAVGQNVTKSTKLVRILKINPVKLRLQVPEMDASRARTGMAISVSVQAYPDRKFPGKVVAINPAVDAATRSMTVEAHVDNGAKLLLPGMFASGRIVQDIPERVLFVPRQAVRSDPNTDSLQLYVVQGGRARLRVVQLGKEVDGNLVSVATGISGGELVATGDLNRLYDGANVKTR